MLIRKRLNLVFFLFIFVTCLVVYILTLAPTVYLEDSGELVAAAHSLGVAHPSGYPLYVILGKLFSLLPFGSIAYKVNLMSAFFGSMTCSVLFLVIQKIFIWLKKAKNYQSKVPNQHQTKQNKYTYWDSLTVNYILPASASLILAFSHTFWSQSVFAEVYTLNSFLFILIIWLLFNWAFPGRDEALPRFGRTNIQSAHLNAHAMDQNKATLESGISECRLQGLPRPYKNMRPRRNYKYLLLAAFIFGLSLTNHQMMILFAPAFLFFVLIIDWKIILNYKLILAALALFLLGLSLYSFMFFRSRFGEPAFNWGNPYNWTNFKYQVLRQQYSDASGLSLHALFNTGKLGFINSMFGQLAAEFTPLGVFLSVIGFIFLWFKDKKIWGMLGLCFVANTFLIIILRDISYHPSMDLVSQVYYLPAFIIMAFFIGLAFYFFYGLIFNLLLKKQPLFCSTIMLIFSGVLVLIPLSFLISNYQDNDKSDFWLVDEYSRNILNSLEPESKILGITDQPAWDSLLFSLMYQQVVNNLRPDVKIINVSRIRGRFYMPIADAFEKAKTVQSTAREQGVNMANSENYSKTAWAEILWGYNQSGLPLYLLYPLGLSIDDQLASRSNGWAYRVYENLDAAQQDDSPYEDLNLKPLPNLQNSNLVNNLFYRDLVSDYYYARCTYYFETGQDLLYRQALLLALEFDTSPLSANYNMFIQHKDIWQGQQPQENIKLVPKELLN